MVHDPTDFPELSYANPGDPWLSRTLIGAVERWAGRGYFVPLYRRWRDEVIPSGAPVMQAVFRLCEVDLVIRGCWPARIAPGVPLVIVANHPYGIIDGFAALHLAEAIGRPFRVLINKDLTKVPEIRPYALPVDFSETRAAQAANLRMRTEAISLLKAGTTIVVFPAGGVATAPSAFSRAVDLPWKTFTARMIQASRAQVLPVWFEGQCSPLFHVASRLNLTLRLSLMIRELRRMVGGRLEARVGPVVTPAELASFRDRLELTAILFRRVHELGGIGAEEAAAQAELLPDYLRGVDR
jgi:putative hemolysin